MSHSKDFFNQHVLGTETSHKDELHHQELWEISQSEQKKHPMQRTCLASEKFLLI